MARHLIFFASHPIPSRIRLNSCALSFLDLFLGEIPPDRGPEERRPAPPVVRRREIVRPVEQFKPVGAAANLKAAQLTSERWRDGSTNPGSFVGEFVSRCGDWTYVVPALCAVSAHGTANLKGLAFLKGFFPERDERDGRDTRDALATT
jgi:hypothetical protein